MVLESKGQLAAGGHGIAGIDGEIEENLMELRVVANDVPEFFGRIDFKLNGLGKSLVHELFDFVGNFPHVQRHAFAFCHAAKGEDLFHQLCAALGAVIQTGQQMREFGIMRLLLEQADGNHDGRENIIQVVRHATGERAQTFDPLAAGDLLLEFAGVRDVHARSKNGLGLTVHRAHQCPGGFDQNFMASFVAAGEFAHPKTIGEQLPPRFGHAK